MQVIRLVYHIIYYAREECKTIRSALKFHRILKKKKEKENRGDFTLYIQRIRPSY